MTPLGNSQQLAAALVGVGLPASVEARDGVAVVTASEGPSGIAGRRGEVVALAKACGFTHVCLEVTAAVP